MKAIEFAVRKPVTVAVGVILVALFGVLAILRLPVQLTPDVDVPVVTVTTRWEGASPQEVELEIVNEQEEFLKSVQGLRRMISTAEEDRAQITMEFLVGSDLSRALLEVNDRLRQVPSYPEGVDEPVISAGETQGVNAIAWFVMLPLPGRDSSQLDIPTLRTLVEERVKPRLERAQGIASVGIFGGFEREVHLELDPSRLAARNLTLLDIRDAIRRHNVDVSAGDLAEGKRSYLVRTVGRFSSLEELENVVVFREEGRTIRLRDLGRVELGYKEPTRTVRSFGVSTIAVNAQRESGTNVLSVMSNLQAAVADVNERLLKSEGVHLVQSYDETEYITGAIDLVLQNLYVGGGLTILVLFFFLRQLRSVSIVALAIPISVLGSFLALVAFDRNLNVISLAGLAFAVGMVVDNSIVVFENIFRHRQRGQSAAAAATVGAGEVWGAVLASTLTTLAVFLPVIFVQEEAGQLFRDIAIAISAAVSLSLIVAVLFIPTAATRLLGKVPTRNRDARDSRVAVAIANFVGWMIGNAWRRVFCVAGIPTICLISAWLLMPPAAYLPEGNRNMVIGFMIPPPGYNMEELERIAEQIEETLEPYFVLEGIDGSEAEPFPDWYDGADPIPRLQNFFYVASGNNVFMGARSVDPDNVDPLVALIEQAAAEVPGAMLFASQRSLFSRSISSGNTIDLELIGDRYDVLQQAATAVMGRISDVLTFPRPDPANFNLGAPELRLVPNAERITELGLSVADLGFMVRALVDGAIISDYRDQGVTIDVKLRPIFSESELIQGLDQIPLFSPERGQVPLSELVTLEQTSAPTQIRHNEERRAVKLAITPPNGMELSRAITLLENQVLKPAREHGDLPPEVDTTFSGTADKLITTMEVLKWNFLLALIITYLLMSALFESFLYPFVILFSVPLAGVGGVAALRIVHSLTGHQLDILTMLGFVILVGTVVNNPILLVYKTLQLIRENGSSALDAVKESVQTRVRPIFMSTTTSLFGMLPLVLFPGSGSELYRGLGSVVLGGLLAATVFSLVVVPGLFLAVYALFGTARRS